MGSGRRATRLVIAGLLALLVITPVLRPAVAKAPPKVRAVAPKTGIAHYADARVVDLSHRIDLHAAYIGHRAAEPTMGVTTDGDAFVAAAETITFTTQIPRIDVLRSTDGGSDWDVVSPSFGGVNVHASTGDPYVFVDNHEDGSRIFTVDLQGYVCSLLSFSDDGGDTWLTNPFACGRPVNDHQTLFSAPPVSSTTVAYPNLIYYCFQEVVGSSCSKSLDGGVSFVPTGAQSFPAYEGDDPTGEFCGALHGHGFGARDGSIYIPKVHCGKPWLSISHDEGATWERRQVARMPAAGHEASVATDAAGNIYFAFIGRDLLPYLALSRNGGRSWSDSMMIGSPGVTESSLPSLAVSRSGRVVMGYMGTETMKRDGGMAETWNGYVTTTSDALARNPLFISAQTNLDGEPMLRGECAQTKCGPVYDFIDVVIDSQGSAWGVFVDGCTQLCTETLTANDDAAGLVIRWQL
jgi:hypothetical protein